MCDSNMSRSRNWKFTLNSDDVQAILIRKAKGNMLKNVTFLQLCGNKGVIVLRNKVRVSAVKKMFSVSKIHPFSAVSVVCRAMVGVTFTYGTLLNKHQKKLANKSTSYVDAVQNFAKTTLVPEEDPQFDTVYNIISSADTVEAGMLKVLEDLPHCRNLISCAVRRYKLKRDQTLHLENKENSKAIVWKPWQQVLLQELEASPDSRKIIWYYDPAGNTGKTFFAKWRSQLDQSTVVLQNGKSNDLYHILAKHTAEIRTVIIDMTRSSIDAVNYNVIECIKNGYFQSNKYDSRFVSIPVPHVVVFANFEPIYSSLSADRWDVRKLTKSSPGRYWLRTEIANVYRTCMCLIHEKMFCNHCWKHDTSPRPVTGI